MNWVFDLDNTIYNTNNINYLSIKTDYYLRCLLNNLDGKKYIFTNATLGHAKMVLNRLGILDIFDDIIDRDIMSSLKPHRTAFDYFINNTNINTNNKTIFFEDNIDNLIMAKSKYNWITVLIAPKMLRNDRNISNYINYIFKDIHTAVENFSFNPGQCYTLK
tara:strand:- start:6290 stop:6775 length:486 start_codon:yes stop_codon:yes gene_type:complete